MELVTGRSGKPHITSQQVRQLQQGIFGANACILNTGSMLTPEVQSSNKIRIKDGALMFQGALFTVKVGGYDEVTINNGNQGMKRKDVIAVKYTYDSSRNIESGEWAVLCRLRNIFASWDIVKSACCPAGFHHKLVKLV